MRKPIWISYDLGLKGDYPGLYNWLDTHKAKECGNNVAFLKYEYVTDISKELLEDLKRNIEFNNGDRIYVILEEQHKGQVQYLGKFFIGNRKSSPWEGYAPSKDIVTDL